MTKGASTLQAKHFAIKIALAYAFRIPHDSIYIFTDSLSALEILKKSCPKDNLKLNNNPPATTD